MSRSRRRGHGRSRSAARGAVLPAVMLLVLGGVAGGTYVALDRYGSPAGVGTCVAEGLGTSHRYDTEQTANAALISAIAVDREMPPRAASIALATAYQESKLRNIDSGDRDSLGLFQQRPSQGWGSEEEILDPVYAANAFYDSLEQLDGYETMNINDAAQTVQRSGYPEAYADHETEGRIYASTFTGYSGANLHCSLAPADGTFSPEGVRDSLATAYPRAMEDGRLRASLGPAAELAPPHDGAGGTALVVDVGENTELGWSVANWAVARAAEDGIVQVSYDGQRWNRDARVREDAWSTAPSGDPERVVILVSGG